MARLVRRGVHKDWTQPATVNLRKQTKHLSDGENADHTQRRNEDINPDTC